jgi:hypothetical protein
MHAPPKRSPAYQSLEKRSSTAFSAREIFEKVKAEKVHPDLRPGIQPHISLHNFGNIPPNSARYRMFYRTRTGDYRLFRPGDDHDPSRTGKIRPEPDDLPDRYRDLVDWYETSYCNGAPAAAEDPVLRMRGVGQELRAGIDADEFVASLRAGWDEGGPSQRAFAALDTRELTHLICERLSRYEGREFRTKSGLPFTYRLDPNGIWFFRGARRINQLPGRRDVETAIRKMPLDRPSDIKGCRDYAYLYGLLTDRRILGDERPLPEGSA